MKPLLCTIAVALLLCVLSVTLYKNNSYMVYKDIPVTLVDRYTSQSCHKSSCYEIYKGVYKTDAGDIFEQRISGYAYRQLHLGEKYSLNIRAFDIRQTGRNNLFWFILPVLFYSIAITSWFAVLVELYALLTKKGKS